MSATVDNKAFNRLTESQRAQWNTDGYLLVEGALSGDEVERLVAAVDRLQGSSDRTKTFNAFNAVESDEVFLDLVDHPRVLGLVADLMGTNLQLLMSQVMVRPPTRDVALGWHHDGPKPYPFPGVSGMAPLLNLKIGWFLTDVSEPNQGNFVVVPGSHVNGVSPGAGALQHSAGETTEIGADMPGAVQILAKPGDAILFHNGLWHAVAASRVERLRKVLYYAYGPTWLRLNDRDAPSPKVLARCDDVRRQLLGGLSRPEDHGGMHPGEEGTPLLRLLEGKSYTEVMEENFLREVAEYAQARG